MVVSAKRRLTFGGACQGVGPRSDKSSGDPSLLPPQKIYFFRRALIEGVDPSQSCSTARPAALAIHPRVNSFLRGPELVDSITLSF